MPEKRATTGLDYVRSLIRIGGARFSHLVRHGTLRGLSAFRGIWSLKPPRIHTHGTIARHMPCEAWAGFIRALVKQISMPKDMAGHFVSCLDGNDDGPILGDIS